ncbi:MAG: hypothetical protein JXR49_09175 [Acidobacteria bacterium]|nr:hypothetical protein [Acidobacteriota bacterium]
MYKALMSLVILTLCSPLFAGEINLAPSRVRFLSVDLWVDSGEALAAYQVEITYDRNSIRIVGLEGGQVEAYRDAPYYDQKGFESGRIILAAFTTGTDAPKGRTRVAIIHVAVEGNIRPELTCRLMAAAKPGGRRISPKVDLIPALQEKRTDEKEKK